MKKILIAVLSVITILTITSCNNSQQPEQQKEYVVKYYKDFYKITLPIVNGIGDNQIVEFNIWKDNIFQMIDTTTLINYIKGGIKYFAKDTLKYKIDCVNVHVSNESYVAPELLKELVDKVHKNEISKKEAHIQYSLNKLSERPDMLISYNVLVKNENSIFVEKDINLHILLDNNNYITEEEIENMEEELKWWE